MEFYPNYISVPEEKRTDRLLLRPLRATDVELDYDAVISSAEMLRGWSQSSWPVDHFSLVDNLKDLERHEREHGEHKAFTFTVMAPDESRCLGCVYIEPLSPEQQIQVCTGAAYPAHVAFWVRTSEIAQDLDKHLLTTLREWLQAEWAFDCLVFSLSPSEERQAIILKEAGLQQRQAFTSSDGRQWIVFA